MIRHFSVVVLFFLSVQTGCEPREAITVAKDGIAMVEAAGKDIEMESQNWRAILNKLMKDLPGETQSLLRNEVQIVLDRAIAAGGVEFRCNADFLGKRVADSLKQVVAAARNKKPHVFQPVFCSTSPSTINGYLDPSRRYQLDITGYNFNKEDVPLSVVRVDENNGQLTETPVDGHLNYLTHYHLTLDLGHKGVPILPTTRRLKISDGSGMEWEVGVIQPAPPAPQTINVELPEMSWTPRNKKGVPPSVEKELRVQIAKLAKNDSFVVRGLRQQFERMLRDGGDLEFSGNGPCITLKAELRIQNNQLQTRLFMDAYECNADMSPRKDFTWATGWSPWKVAYTPDDGVTILEVLSPTLANSNQYRDNDHSVRHQSPSGLVSLFESWGDGPGDDVGSNTRMKASFNDARVLVQYSRPGFLSVDAWEKLKENSH